MTRKIDKRTIEKLEGMSVDELQALKDKHEKIGDLITRILRKKVQ